MARGIYNGIDAYIEYYQKKYIGVQVTCKLKLLIAIIAINRCKKIPILYPNYPNIQDYINSTKIPITLKDDHFNRKQFIANSSVVNL